MSTEPAFEHDPLLDDDLLGAPEPIVGGLQPRLVDLREVPLRQSAWLSPKWFPAGKLTVLDGDPDAGKSLMLFDLAARVSTTGIMPDGSTGAQGHSLLIVTDPLADVVRPRLEAAGADLGRLTVLQTVHEGDCDERLVFPRDLPLLRDIVIRSHTKLMIIDPLSAFMQGDVPKTLRGLELLAAETGCAIVMVRHLTRGSGRNPLHRGAGPQAIISAASVGLLLARDPELPERRVLLAYRNKLGKLPAARTFTLSHEPLTEVGGSDGQTSHDRAVAPRLVWGEVSEWSAAELLAPHTSAVERSLLNDACRLLEQATLTGPVAVETLRQQAHQIGISDATLQRAKQMLGLHSRRQGLGRNGFWHWSRADDPGTMPIKFPSREDNLELTYRDRRPGDPLSWPTSKEGRAKIEKVVADSHKATSARVRDLVEQMAERYCYSGYDETGDDDAREVVQKPDISDEEEYEDDDDFPDEDELTPEEWEELADRPSVPNGPRGPRGVARDDQVWKKPGKKPLSRPKSKASKPGIIQRIVDSLTGK